MKTANIATRILVIVGALNWGLVAIAEFDLVAALFGMEFGETNAITRIVYGLVGISAIYQIAQLFGTETRRAPAISSPRTAA